MLNKETVGGRSREETNREAAGDSRILEAREGWETDRETASDTKTRTGDRRSLLL